MTMNHGRQARNSQLIRFSPPIDWETSWPIQVRQLAGRHGKLWIILPRSTITNNNDGLYMIILWSTTHVLYCSMISMDVLTRNHKHSKILAQMSFGKRRKKDAREVQASISPFASITFHTSIAWQRWWVKKRRLYQTMMDLSKQSAWEWVENPRHRILPYFT